MDALTGHGLLSFHANLPHVVVNSLRANLVWWFTDRKWFFCTWRSSTLICRTLNRKRKAHAQPSKDLSGRVTATSPGCMACYWKPVRCSLEASALQCSMLSRDQTSMHSLDDNLVIWEPLAHFAKKHKVQSKLIANCFSLSTAAVVGWLRQWPLPFRKHCTSLTAMLPNGHPMLTIICVSRKQF